MQCSKVSPVSRRILLSCPYDEENGVGCKCVTSLYVGDEDDNGGNAFVLLGLDVEGEGESHARSNEHSLDNRGSVSADTLSSGASAADAQCVRCLGSTAASSFPGGDTMLHTNLILESR